MKPTLEEIQEYFKNAKEVRCLVDGKVYKLNLESITEVLNEDSDNICGRDFNINHICLWSFDSEEYAEIVSYKESEIEVKDAEIVTPKHYNNENGTLYKVATERNWNAYLFDIVKRLERAEKKGEFDQDLEKSIAVIQLWKKERNGQ